MAKQKYTRFTTEEGRAIFPHLTRLDTKFNPEGLYSIRLAVEPNENVNAQIAKLEEIRDAFIAADVAANPKRKKHLVAEVVAQEENDAGEETGFVVFNFKMKAKVTNKKTGETWEQKPGLFDSANKPLTVKFVGNGSMCRVNGEVVPYFMESSKTYGVSLRLKAVQVTKLVQGGGSPFDTFEGGFTADDEESDAPFNASGDSLDTTGGDDDADGDY